MVTMIRTQLFLFLVFVLFLTLPVDAFAATEVIYDEANLLTKEEKASLQSLAEKQSKKRKTDFIIVTIKEDTATDIEAYMQNLYDEKELGYNEAYGDAVILGIDIDRRIVAMHGYGEAEERLDADRQDLILDEIADDLSDGAYLSAFEQYISLSSDYIRYKAGANPRNVLYKIWGQLLAAVLFAGAIVGMMVRHTNPKVTTTAATYRDESRTKINRKRDRYLRKSVNRRLKPQSNQNRTSRGRSSSSSPRTGRTSGGHSHSRSRRKF